MKYVLWAIPLVLWVACYFAWSYSERFIAAHGATAIWWIITDSVLGTLTFVSFFMAVDGLDYD